MTVLHIVPLPGIQPGLWRGFSFIVELGEGESFPDEQAAASWKAFADDSGARGVLIIEGDLVILGPSESQVQPGPCPSYMEGLGVSHVCDLRHGHTGLHEENIAGDGVNPPRRATWGERERFMESSGFTAVMMAAPPIDLSGVKTP